MRLAILTTHPVQYCVPWYRALASSPGCDLTIFYCLLPDARQQGEGFGVDFKWDLPLLEGYKYHVLANRSREPGVTRFSGCDTPEIADIIAGSQKSEVSDPIARPPSSVLRRPSSVLRSALCALRSPAPDLQSPISNLRSSKSFDAVIVNGWLVKSCIQALRACRKAGVPCLVRGESNAMRPRAAWKRMIHRLLLKQYSAFLAIGRSNRDFYLQHGVNANRIFDVPYGVDNARFAAQAAEVRGQRSEVRRRWGIPSDATVFLFSGKFIPKKRPLDLIQAAATLCSDLRPPTSALPSPLSSLHLLMVGSGELGAQLRQHCHITFDAENRDSPLRLDRGENAPKRDFAPCPLELGWGQPVPAYPVGTSCPHPEVHGEGQGKVLEWCSDSPSPLSPLPSPKKPAASFTGFLNQQEMAQAYVAADCLVLPSDHGETWGLVVNEAMACGLPAIVSDQVGCGPDLIQPGVTGEVYPCGDTGALASILTKYANNPDLLRRMGANAALHVQDYSIEKAVQGTLQAVKFVTSAKR